MVNVTEVYYGPRLNMIAEASAWDPRQIGVSAKECQYLVMPYGDAQFDTEWFATRKFAREHAKYIAAQYAGCKVVSV